MWIALVVGIKTNERAVKAKKAFEEIKVPKTTSMIHQHEVGLDLPKTLFYVQFK